MSETETTKLLKELLKWTKVTSISHVKNLLEVTLTSTEQRLAYQSSTGKNVREVAIVAHVSKSTIANWWAEWVRLGLAEMSPVRGGDRAIRSFSLEDFGLDVTKVDSTHSKSG